MPTIDEIRQQWDSAPALPPSANPLGFSESLKEAYDYSYAVDSEKSLQQVFYEIDQRMSDEIYKNTGQRVTPLFEQPEFKQPGGINVYRQLAEHYELGAPLPEPLNKYVQERDALAAGSQARAGQFDPTIPSYKALWDVRKAEAQAAEQRAMRSAARGDSWSAFAGGFAGAAGGALDPRVSPRNLGTIMMGGVGKTVFGRIATEMAVGAGVEAVNQFSDVQYNRRLLGLPEGNPWTNIAAAGLGAGVLRGAGEAAGAVARGVGRKMQGEPFVARRATPTERADASVEEKKAFVKENTPYGKDAEGQRMFVEEFEAAYRQANSWEPQGATFGSRVAELPETVGERVAGVDIIDAPMARVVDPVAVDRIAAVESKAAVTQTRVEALQPILDAQTWDAVPAARENVVRAMDARIAELETQKAQLPRTKQSSPQRSEIARQLETLKADREKIASAPDAKVQTEARSIAKAARKEAKDLGEQRAALVDRVNRKISPQAGRMVEPQRAEPVVRFSDTTGTIELAPASGKFDLPQAVEALKKSEPQRIEAMTKQFKKPTAEEMAKRQADALEGKPADPTAPDPEFVEFGGQRVRRDMVIDSKDGQDITVQNILDDMAEDDEIFAAVTECRLRA